MTIQNFHGGFGGTYSVLREDVHRTEGVPLASVTTLAELQRYFKHRVEFIETM